MKEMVVELFEYKRKYEVLKKKERIFSMKILLQDNEMYTEETYRSE